MTTTHRPAAYLALGSGLAALYAVIFALVWFGLVARSPVVFGAAATFDLTVTAALVTYLVGVRRGALPQRTPFVVLALGFVAARLLLPADARQGLVVMRFGWFAVELALLAILVTQIGAIRRRYRANHDAAMHPIDALAAALSPSVGGLAARFTASELAALGYALGAWRRPTPAEDERTFSMHRTAHYGAVIGVFVFLIVVESACVHVLLQASFPVAAWLATGSSLWVALWLIGDAHAARLSPLRLLPNGIAIGVGLRWRVFIPYADLQTVEITDSPTVDEHVLRAGVLGATNVRLTLARPLIAHGLFGRSRSFSTLLLSVDRAAVLRNALAPRL